MARYAGGIEIEQEISFWFEINQIDVPPVKGDFSDAEPQRIKEYYKTCCLKLDEMETKAFLTKAHQALGTNADDLLLSALCLTRYEWTGHRRTAVMLEGHGRDAPFDSCNVTRTVGWFTSFYPVVLDLKDNMDVAKQVVFIKEQLRAVPNKGLGYGALRYLRQNDDRIAAVSSLNPQFAFNYLGQFADEKTDGLFHPLRDDIGEAMSPQTEMMTDLAILGMVTSGILEISWTYHTQVFAEETMERVSAIFLRKLREVIRACRNAAVTLTPSDLSVSDMSVEELDDFLNQFE